MKLFIFLLIQFSFNSLTCANDFLDKIKEDLNILANSVQTELKRAETEANEIFEEIASNPTMQKCLETTEAHSNEMLKKVKEGFNSLISSPDFTDEFDKQRFRLDIEYMEDGFVGEPKILLFLLGPAELAKYRLDNIAKDLRMVKMKVNLGILKAMGVNYEKIEMLIGEYETLSADVKISLEAGRNELRMIGAEKIKKLEHYMNMKLMKKLLQTTNALHHLLKITAINTKNKILYRKFFIMMYTLLDVLYAQNTTERHGINQKMLSGFVVGLIEARKELSGRETNEKEAKNFEKGFLPFVSLDLLEYRYTIYGVESVSMVFTKNLAHFNFNGEEERRGILGKLLDKLPIGMIGASIFRILNFTRSLYAAKIDKDEDKTEFKIFNQIGKLLAYYVTLFPTFQIPVETDSDGWLKELEKYTKNVPLLEAENVSAIPEKFVEIFMGSKKFMGLNHQAYRICNNFQLYADFRTALLKYEGTGGKDRRAGIKLFHLHRHKKLLKEMVKLRKLLWLAFALHVSLQKWFLLDEANKTAENWQKVASGFGALDRMLKTYKTMPRQIVGPNGPQIVFAGIDQRDAAAIAQSGQFVVNFQGVGNVWPAQTARLYYKLLTGREYTFKPDQLQEWTLLVSIAKMFVFYYEEAEKIRVQQNQN